MHWDNPLPVVAAIVEHEGGVHEPVGHGDGAADEHRALGAVDLARSERVRLAQEQLRTELPDWTDAEFEAFAARHTPGYWLKTDETRRAKQARLLREAEKAGRTVVTAYETDQFRGVTELTICRPTIRACSPS